MAKTFSYQASTALHPGLAETAEGWRFAVTAPADAEAELLLYETENNRLVSTIRFPESGRTGSVWALEAELPEDKEFTYLFRVNGREVIDPRAYCLTERSGAKTRKIRARVLVPPISDEAPLGLPWNQTILYKLHVRGYTMGKGSGVKAKGTFLGLAEKLDEIKELGVTSLVLMPCYEFDTDGRNYWGYAPGFYYAPKRSYCATDEPTEEFAAFVKACHEAELECIPEFCFPPELSSREAADILRHWALSYGVDGFHILGKGNWLSELQRDPVLADRKLFLDEVLPGAGENAASWTPDYKYAMRRFLAGDRSLSVGEIGNYLSRNRGRGVYVNYFADHDGFTLADAVSYSEKRNEENGQENTDGPVGEPSWNCGAEGKTGNARVNALRLRYIYNAFSLLLLSQGVPMIYAGDEFLNSQNGNNNAWCQDNETGWVNRSRRVDAAKLSEFVAGLIRLRKEHPVLARNEAFRRTDHLGIGFPDVSFHDSSAWVTENGSAKDGLAMLLNGAYAGTSEEKETSFFIACNPNAEGRRIALPNLPGKVAWQVILDTDGENRTGGKIDAAESYVSLAPQSVLLLAMKE